MRIGELAARTRCAVETIRYYEKAGLLPEPRRSAANYRVYGREHAERLRFIRRCRSLDMTLEEIRVLLRLREAPEADCGRVNALLDEHIAHVVDRIAALRELERQLRNLRRRCARARPMSECGILQGLDSAPAGFGASGHDGHVGGAHERRPRA
jgi:Cd(II)/Pb(II)-responsive transcriptional regulator